MQMSLVNCKIHDTSLKVAEYGNNITLEEFCLGAYRLVALEWLVSTASVPAVLG